MKPHTEFETGRPVILLADEDADALGAVEQALSRRFGADYRVLSASTSAQALGMLETHAAESQEVALVAAALRMVGADGPALLRQAHTLHPGAVRAFLTEMGDAGASSPAHAAMVAGKIDFAIPGGWESPEEWLYPTVQQALTSWSNAHRPRHEHIRLVGEQWSPRCHELRDILTRNMVPFGFYEASSEEGHCLLAEHQLTTKALPVMILFDGQTFVNPTNAELAGLLGARTRPEPGVYDVAILGAGPAGLTAAVYAASEGLRTVVIEPHALGGQAGSSSMIRNYPGFPRGISGGELTYRIFEQAVLLGARFVFSSRATGLSAHGDTRIVTLSDGSEVECRSLVIATGVSYRRLDIPALDRLLGMGVYYGAAASEAAAVFGHHVCVVGGANSAGQAALYLAKYAARVTILARGRSLAATMSDYLLRDIEATPNIKVRTQTQIVDARGADHLESLTLEDMCRGDRMEVDATAAFVMIGAEPHTDWLANAVEHDHGGYVLTGADVASTGWPLTRPPLPRETSLPGVFAIGDVRSGSIKRVVSAAGDGGVAIGMVHRYLAGVTRDATPGEPVAVSQIV